MPQSPITEKSNLLSFKILTNGTEITSVVYDQVIDMRIEQQLNRISEAELTLRDGNPASKDFPISDSEAFIPGKEIEIQLGYEGQNTSVFKGVVVKMAITVDEFEGSRLKIHCRDKSLKMTVTKKNAIYLDQTDSAIMEQIAQNSGLENEITATSVQHKKMVQFYASDWDFILSRAEANGMVVLTNSGKLVVAKPVVSGSSALKVTYGTDIHELDCEMDASTQYQGVTGYAWDIAKQSTVNSSASSPSLNDQGNISASTLAQALSAGVASINTTVPLDASSIQIWADATLLKSNLSRFKGSVHFQGSSLAKANATIELDGLGARFNGNAFISGVVHHVNSKGWITEAKIGLSDKWFIENPYNKGTDASALLPGVKGLQTGIVKKIDQDPNNEFRVQVEVPILGAEGKNVWARLSTFYAGNTFGSFFMPELNDEVILGFMNDDPRYPIILGSLYSTAIAAPLTPDAENTIKTIITSSKLQLKFDDKNKVVTVLTPGGNTCVLSDQDKGIKLTDQQGNFVQMNDKGITVESKSSMTIKAAESLTIQAASVSVTADESLKMSGGTVSMTGNESTAITGSASCSISSDGEMAVKGSMVMIN